MYRSWLEQRRYGAQWFQQCIQWRMSVSLSGRKWTIANFEREDIFYLNLNLKRYFELNCWTFDSLFTWSENSLNACKTCILNMRKPSGVLSQTQRVYGNRVTLQRIWVKGKIWKRKRTQEGRKGRKKIWNWNGERAGERRHWMHGVAGSSL